MSGGISLPQKAAAEKMMEANRQATLGQLRCGFAKGAHEILLARASDAGIEKGADAIAADAVIHADALMRALFPGFRVGPAEG